MSTIRSVGVFCGSARGKDPAHEAAARRLGALIGERGLDLVYGGARVGTMGVVADAALAAGGRVIGVMPRGLERFEVAHPNLTELLWTEDLHARKREMVARSDAFVVLPGGFGTLEEALEVISWRQMRVLAQPVALVDTLGFFRPLVAMAEAVAVHGFAHGDLPPFTVVPTPEGALQALGVNPGGAR